MIGGEIKNKSCSCEKSLKWRESECTHAQEVVNHKFANQRLLFHSAQNWIFGGRFDLANYEFSFIQRQDLKIQQSRTSKICLIQVKRVKTVRSNHSYLNAFVFLVRYYSDAYRHVYFVVKGESQLHKGSSPSTPSSPSSFSEFTGSTPSLSLSGKNRLWG